VRSLAWVTDANANGKRCSDALERVYVAVDLDVDIVTPFVVDRREASRGCLQAEWAARRLLLGPLSRPRLRSCMWVCRGARALSPQREANWANAAQRCPLLRGTFHQLARVSWRVKGSEIGRFGSVFR
jgi:hypothetical protein